MYFDPSKVPHTATGRPSIRSFGGTGSDAGDAKFNFNQYIRERGDAKIHNLTELLANSTFWNDPNPAMPNRRSGLVNTDRATTLATASATQNRFAWQTVVHACFAQLDLDAVVSPTGNVPPGVLTSPEEPSLNDRGIVWSGFSAQGFPAMTVPSGFTTQVYDRDASGALLPRRPRRCRSASSSSACRSASRSCSRSARPTRRRPRSASRRRTSRRCRRPRSRR